MLKKTMTTLRIALAQLNPTVGNLKGNAEKVISAIKEAESYGVDILVFPELSIIGSPPNDLLFCESFLKQAEAETNRLIPYTKNMVAILGSICKEGRSLFNSAYIMAYGKKNYVYHKRSLTERFHVKESRYFNNGSKPCVLKMDGASIEVIMGDEIEEHALRDGVSIHLIMDSSFYRLKEIRFRKRRINSILSKGIVGYANLSGGQDEWIFSGGSFFSNNGRVMAESPLFVEDLLILDVSCEKGVSCEGAIELEKKRNSYPPLPKRKERWRYTEIEEVINALIVSTGDYFKKNGFGRIFIGLSGGIDSAIVAYIASKAVGREKVTCLFMPTRYTSKESYEDAKEIAKNLGVNLVEIPIDKLFDSYLNLLKNHMGEGIGEITAENIQPRIRANILMAFSNNFNGLVLTTANKSEIATGYCTLYGDTAGGFSVLKDIPKTLVYRIANYINRKEGMYVIPKRVLEKPPSAELKYGQKDSDTLPPYELLDTIIGGYIEGEIKLKKQMDTIDPKAIEETRKRFLRNEFKRKQSPIGPIISSKSFLEESNFQITNLWRC